MSNYSYQLKRDNDNFVENICTRHVGVGGYLKAGYLRDCRRSGYRVANQNILGMDSDLKRKNGALSCSMDLDSILDLAEVKAKWCKLRVESMSDRSDLFIVSYAAEEYVTNSGLAFPLVISKNDSHEQVRKKIMGALLRVSCARWWNRQLKKILTRQTEKVLRGSGWVRKQKAPYLSDWAFGRWKISQEKNKKVMGALECVNEEGEAFDMAECIKSSVSNPENMRNELMVRMRGFEEIATGLGYVGLFFTLTTPSRFHAQLSKGGINPNFDGSSPRDAMEYLNKTWSLIRAEWKRESVSAFGFRVCEPHHDGTPHWHLLLFVEPSEQSRACEIFGRYALAVDGDESGAVENRWDVKIIDPARGGAAAYIAKYVSKNLDGYGVGIDEEGECVASVGARRVKAWASTWGIRQFQQIGSVSVTVWRELRRRREILEEHEPQEIEALRKAANDGDWRLFVELMGGPVVRRDELTLRPEYVESETKSGDYGDGVKRLVGVWLQPVARAIGRFLSTREHVWEIREKRCVFEVGVGGLGEAKPPPLDLYQ